MKRKELELKVNDAADGLLNASEIHELKQVLEQHPDLLQSYRDIMELPDFSRVYGEDPGIYRIDLKVHQVKKEIDKMWSQLASFEEISLAWFRKYAFAASLLIFALTSFFYMTAPEPASRGGISPAEYIYPDDESSADGYILYLDEWIEQ